MNTPLYTSIKRILDKESIEYEEAQHEPVYTSDMAGDVSGHANEEGTKSLVLELGTGGLAVVTVTGGDRVDFKLIKKVLREKKITMCQSGVLSGQLGTEIGGVAPFGYGANVKLVVSPKLFRQKNVYFNAGRNDVTIKVSGQDFQKAMALCGAIVLE